MKKKILAVLMATMILFSSCNYATVSAENVSNKNTNNEPMSMFIEIERTSLWSVVYHKETKVMYAVSAGSYNFGTFTLMVDSDGSPLLWQE